MESTNITIGRLDYKNQSERGDLYILPSLTSIEQIEDVNEVSRIIFKFETREQAEAFATNFPKSYKGSVCGVWSANVRYFILQFNFNTFFLNASTGGENESAISRRLKVIKKIQSL